MLDGVIRANVEGVAERGGFRIARWLGTKRASVGGRSALLSEYHKSSGPAGADIRDVRIFMVRDGQRSFTLTVSCDLALAATLKPVTDRIASSQRWE